MRNLLVTDDRGNQVCAASLATHQRTKRRYIMLRHRQAEIRIPVEQAYALADTLVAIAEAVEQRTETRHPCP